MSTFACRFCDHPNPQASQYCNACGSPLNLKPCPQCQAVNNADAATCYQCNAAFRIVEPTEIAVGERVEAEASSTVLVEKPRTPELFAQSLDALAELEKMIAGTRKSPRAFVPATLLVAEAAREPIRYHRRRRLQGVALALALLVAVESLVYFAHRPNEAIDARLGEIQRDVAMAARASVAEPSATTADSAVVGPTRAVATPSSADARAPGDSEPNATVPVPSQATTEAVASSPTSATIAEPLRESQRASEQHVVSTEVESAAALVQPEPPAAAPSKAAGKPAAAAASASRRKPGAARPYDPPAPSRAAELPAVEIASPIERPCTQAVAAIGLCDAGAAQPK
jgi:hypothetical protein